MKNNKSASIFIALLAIVFMLSGATQAYARKAKSKSISGKIGYANSDNKFKKVDQKELAEFFKTILSLPAQTQFEDYKIQYIPATNGKSANTYLHLRSSNSTVVIASSLTKVSRGKYAIDGNGICTCTTASYDADKNYDVIATSNGCMCKSTAGIAEKTSIAVNTAYIQQLFEKHTGLK